jgi:hypothetical protein
MDLRFEFRVLSKVVWKPASDSIDKKQENVTRSIISKEHKRLEVGAWGRWFGSNCQRSQQSESQSCKGDDGFAD